MVGALETSRRWVGLAMIMLILLSTLPFPSAYYRFVAQMRLTPASLGNSDDDVYELERVKTILRGKHVLSAVGNSARSKQLDEVLTKRIAKYASRGYYDNPNGRLTEMAKVLWEGGAVPHAHNLLSAAGSFAETTKNIGFMARVSAAWREMGESKHAQEALESAMRIYGSPEEPPPVGYDRKADASRLAMVLFDAERKEDARLIFKELFSRIRSFNEKHPPQGEVIPSWFDKDSGRAVWGTGVWDSLPLEWSCELGISRSVATSMLRDDKANAALEVVFHPKSHQREHEVHLDFVTSAAEQGKYSVAFEVLNRIKPESSREWSGHEIACLDAIAKVAYEKDDVNQFKHIGSECRNIIRAVELRQLPPYDTYQLYFSLAKILAISGELDQAQLLSERAGPNCGELLTACAEVYIRRGEFKKARELLGRGWKSASGQLWVRAQDLDVAKHIAEEHESGVPNENSRLSAFKIYAAILETGLGQVQTSK